jgi:SAM-dependent methyltransferase
MTWNQIPLIGDLVKKWSPVETWLYDRVIADAVGLLRLQLVADITDIAGAGGTILDVGAGGGQLACDLAGNFPHVRIVGIDASPQQVKRASRRARPFGDRVQFFTAVADDLPFADASFAAVVSSGSIKHWPDQAAGLAEMVRVAQPGGVIVVAELDRGCTLADTRSFVATWRIPSVLREVFVAFFRTYLGGQSLDIEDHRRLAGSLPLDTINIAQVPGFPAVQMTARKKQATPVR